LGISVLSLPQTQLGELQCSPDPLAVFKGALVLRGVRRKEREGEKWGEERGREGNRGR